MYNLYVLMIIKLTYRLYIFNTNENNVLNKYLFLFSFLFSIAKFDKVL